MLKEAPPDLEFITYCSSDCILNYFLLGNTLKKLKKNFWHQYIKII